MADARFLKLPLIGGLDLEAHDWRNLFNRFGLWAVDQTLSKIMFGLGWAGIFLTWAWIYKNWRTHLLIGGIFLVYIAFTMLTNNKTANLFSEEEGIKEDIAFMPMTFPLFIGPAAISSVIIQSSEFTLWSAKLISIVEFVLIGILIWISLKLAKRILKTLGKAGIKFITQVMGLLLGSLAIGIIAEALKVLLPGLS